MMCKWKKYILWFAHDHVEFRLPEIQSLLSLLNIEMRWLEKPAEHPCWIVEMKSDESVKKLASRSIALRGAIDLWAYAETSEELHSQLKALPPAHYEKYFQPHLSFKIEVETFNNHISMPELIDKIETFSYLPVAGPVDLKNPDVKLWHLEYYGQDPNKVPEKPFLYFFGRWITKGQRDLIPKLSLKKRKFIGNTSMDAQLSLLMANQAKVKNGDIVLDPFVGTGSLLVAAAHFGAFVLGTDIDYLILHARTRPSRIQQKVREADESIKANLKQYGVEKKYLDVVVADSSRPVWREDFKLDAIITDPPYGVREATERIGTKKVSEISEEQAASHIPSKVGYGHDHLYQDLLHFAATQLCMGGRLVTFIPFYREDYDEESLPKHPCLSVVANSEEVLSSLISRRLLTYEKTAEPDCVEDVTSTVPVLEKFRERYFRPNDESRQERRQRQAAIRQNGLKFRKQGSKIEDELISPEIKV